MELATAPTTNGYKASNPIAGLDNLSRWIGGIAQRPAAQAGVKVAIGIAEPMDTSREEGARACSRNARTTAAGEPKKTQ